MKFRKLNNREFNNRKTTKGRNRKQLITHKRVDEKVKHKMVLLGAWIKLPESINKIGKIMRLATTYFRRRTKLITHQC